MFLCFTRESKFYMGFFWCSHSRNYVTLLSSCGLACQPLNIVLLLFKIWFTRKILIMEICVQFLFSSSSHYWGNILLWAFLLWWKGWDGFRVKIALKLLQQKRIKIVTCLTTFPLPSSPSSAYQHALTIFYDVCKRELMKKNYRWVATGCKRLQDGKKFSIFLRRFPSFLLA